MRPLFFCGPQVQMQYAAAKAASKVNIRAQKTASAEF